ncbi:hypothetical protein FB567DRAFT_79762 [Paraphoma chrysanthemicola]|uniref:Uncharacterized protein n=1 Tax=Paraphoma chrysanthemicola TaxID=798071 RepID=A0A8K0VWR9_9PLEO|nr:hypothetical protein FB567DRAFT_79762 [Paraphoma chrysanthemicola]
MPEFVITSSQLFRVTSAVSSLVLVALSIATFYKTGHAFKSIAVHFPADTYPWYGPQLSWPPKSYRVPLDYDWRTENYLFVAAGTSIVAGILGLVHIGLSAKNDPTKQTSLGSKVVFFTTAFFTLSASIATLVSTIAVNVIHASVERSTCHLTLGGYPGGRFKCTRELAVCHIVPFLLWRDQDEAWKDCQDTRMSREMLYPLLAFSWVLVGVYGLRIWMDRKGESYLSAEERVERLRQEE